MTKAASVLIEERRLVRSEAAPSGYEFDNPYFRGWVIRHALGDLGMGLPESTTPATRSPYASAAVRKRTSIAGRMPLTRGLWVTRMVPSSTSRW